MVQSFYLGVAAVVSFYMLAGYVVCHLLLNVFESGKSLFARFYIERALRIFPLYLFVLILTVVFICVTGYGRPRFEFSNTLRNILIVPLNYSMFIDNSVLTMPENRLVPPAWSLGAELQAYLLLPFIIMFKPVKIVSGAVSLAIFCIACTGAINPDTYGYRLVPGIIFIFILGACVSKNTKNPDKTDWFDRHFPPVCYTVILFLLITLGIMGRLFVPYIRETMLGILIGLPIISFIAKSRLKLPFNNFLADMSFGLFLSHFLAVWAVDYWKLVNRNDNETLYVFLVFGIAVLISLAGVLVVETKIKKYRFGFSGKKV